MNPTTPSDQLTQLYALGRTFQFVEQAHRTLRGAPHAPQLASLTVRALVELGLGGPARELVQIRRDLPDAGGELAKLKVAMTSLPNGRVSWAEREEVFTRNVEALLRHRPHLAGLADSFREAVADLQLYRTRSGAYQLSDRRQAGQLRVWHPVLTDEGDEAAVELPPRGRLGVTAIIGVRVGDLIPRIYRDTHHLFLNYSHPLYLIEQDLGRFAAWLFAADHSEWLHDERVYPLIGATCVEDFDRLLTGEPSLSLPVVQVTLCAEAPLPDTIQKTTDQISKERQTELAQVLSELETRYRGRDTMYWAKRMRTPGRAIGVTSRFTTMLQYSTRDALHALEELGYEPHMLIEGKDHFLTSQTETCRRILELDPDLLIFLDHLRYEYPHIPKNLPLLTWIQDPMDHLLCGKAGASVGPLDLVCGYYRDRCTEEFGYPEDRFVATDLPVSTRLFHDGDLDPEVLAEYACDISFVSNASTPIEQVHASAVRANPEPFRPMIDILYERAAGIGHQKDRVYPAEAAFDLVRSVAAECGIVLDDGQVQTLAIHYVYRLFDWGRRQESLEWVADWARRTGRVFKIYGRGWENHPSLSEFAAGPIEHGEPLRRANRASTLALQLIPSGFRHQRSYELLASGTLPLTRYCRPDFERPQARERFPQLERIVFRTPEEFDTLAERLLVDNDHRREVLGELRAVVLRHYTYAAVMGEVIEHWRGYLDHRASTGVLFVAART